MSTQTTGVARVIAEMVKGKTELDPELGGQVAGALAKHFKVSTDEVAILRLAPRGKQLEFVVPEKLANIGTIPLTSTHALAVRTVRDGRSEFVNSFGSSQHPTVFEGVRLKRGETSDPIQKIVSVPIQVGGKAVGAIQVSRKGKSAGAAGADFGAADVEVLTQVAASLAACFQPK
ncbi:MAG: hypothetical protein HYY26_03350 [Acidobacteria bacterium]|nr:hypothetical protein [Acidobacteriota bacterium]